VCNTNVRQSNLYIIYPEEFKQGYDDYRASRLQYYEIMKRIEASHNRKPGVEPKAVKGSVYFFRVKDSDLFKIGITKGKVAGRLYGIQTSCPYPIELYASYRTTKFQEDEAELHDRFQDRRTVGEWFELDPSEIDAIILEMRER